MQNLRWWSRSRARCGGSSCRSSVCRSLSVTMTALDPSSTAVWPSTASKRCFCCCRREEMFFRAFRHADFDVCELSLSSFTLRSARGDNPYVGIPVFPSRAFRHTAIVVRRDRGIDSPQDLKGRRIGTPEYQLSACVWARGLLQDEYGVRPEDIRWVRGGMEDPGRIEKISLNLPPAVQLESAPADRTLSEMLAAGEIDGIIGPRLPSLLRRSGGQCRLVNPGRGADGHAGISSAPASFRSCMSSACAAPWPSSIRGCRRRCSRPSVPQNRWPRSTFADTSAAKASLPLSRSNCAAARRRPGSGLLVVWIYGGEPQGPGYVSGLSPCAGTVRAARDARRIVSSRGAGALQDLEVRATGLPVAPVAVPPSWRRLPSAAAAVRHCPRGRPCLSRRGRGPRPGPSPCPRQYVRECP